MSDSTRQFSFRASCRRAVRGSSTWLLKCLHRFWATFPEFATRWEDWDEDSQNTFLMDRPLMVKKRRIIVQAEAAGGLTPAQRVRWHEVQRLTEAHRAEMEALLGHPLRGSRPSDLWRVTQAGRWMAFSAANSRSAWATSAAFCSAGKNAERKPFNNSSSSCASDSPIGSISVA